MVNIADFGFFVAVWIFAAFFICRQCFVQFGTSSHVTDDEAYM
jgi:hypothetical protein